MKLSPPLAAFAAAALLLTFLGAPAAAAATPAATIPADPWPRDISISNAAVLIYQPQVNKWEGDQIDFRAALAIKPTGAKEETFGVVFATARTAHPVGQHRGLVERVRDEVRSRWRLRPSSRSRSFMVTRMGWRWSIPSQAFRLAWASS